MKVTITKTVNYVDVDTAFRLKPATLFQLFQDVAITHMDAAGYGFDESIRNGDGWVLNKLHMAIYRCPEYREGIRAVTWCSQMRGAKGFREFEIFSGEEKVAAASAIYVFLNTHLRKVKRIPKDMAGNYTIEPDVALNPDLDRWAWDNNSSPETALRFSIRFFDFDPMGHVNNSIFIQFLETMIMHMTGESHFQIKSLKMQYHKEIDISVKEVWASMDALDGVYQFKIFDAENLYAGGIVALA